MTRKDYILIASTLQTVKANLSRIIELDGHVTHAISHEEVCNIMSAALEETNPLFDRDRFLKACGVDNA